MGCTLPTLDRVGGCDRRWGGGVSTLTAAVRLRLLENSSLYPKEETHTEKLGTPEEAACQKMSI